MHEAKTSLAKLVERAIGGEEVVISRAGKPAAKLVALHPVKRARRLGLLDRKRYRIPDDFNKPLPAAIRRAFEGKK